MLESNRPSPESLAQQIELHSVDAIEANSSIEQRYALDALQNDSLFLAPELVKSQNGTYEDKNAEYRKRVEFELQIDSAKSALPHFALSDTGEIYAVGITARMPYVWTDESGQTHMYKELKPQIKQVTAGANNAEVRIVNGDIDWPVDRVD